MVTTMVAWLSCTFPLNPKQRNPAQAGADWMATILLIWGVCSVARRSCDSGGGVGDPELSSPTSNSTWLTIDLSVLEIACKVWQAQALQEFNIQSACVWVQESLLCVTGSIFRFMSTSSFATCRKSRYISLKYCKHTGAGQHCEIHAHICKYKIYIHRYTSACLS